MQYQLEEAKKSLKSCVSCRLTYRSVFLTARRSWCIIL
uniref:Uncharacterized protein n=1 Tax=Rhizophora mucronata TaxID=61149 RepID=A0A2P2P027_RHIMU